MTGSGSKSAKNRSREIEKNSNAGPAHLCYVDDSRTSAYVVKRLLRPYGYTVDHFDSAEPALVALVEDQYDLLLTDLKVSPEGMDGDDLVRALRNSGHKHVSSLPVIVITGATDEHVLNNVYAAGANQIMSKPVNGDELDEHIRNLVESYRNGDGDFFVEAEEEPEFKLETNKKSESTVVPFGHDTKHEPEADAESVGRRNLKTSAADESAEVETPQPVKHVKRAKPVTPTIRSDAPVANKEPSAHKEPSAYKEPSAHTAVAAPQQAQPSKPTAAPDTHAAKSSEQQLAARERLLKAKALAKKKRMAEIAAARRQAEVERLASQQTPQQTPQQQPPQQGQSQQGQSQRQSQRQSQQRQPQQQVPAASEPLTLEPLDNSSYHVFAPTLDQQVTPESLAARSTNADQPIDYQPVRRRPAQRSQQAQVPPQQAQEPPQQAQVPPQQAQVPPQQAQVPPQQEQVPPQEPVQPSAESAAHSEKPNRPSGGFQSDLEAASNILQEMERYPLVEADFGNTYSPSRFVSVVGSVMELYGPRKLFTFAVVGIALFFLYSIWSEYFDEGKPVQYIVAEQGEIFQSINVPGKVVSKLRTNITPSIAGRLTQIKVEEGDKVKTGDLLALLDDREAKSYLKRAMATHESAKEDVLLAERALKRLNQAFSKGAVAKQLVEEAEVELRSAKARESIAAEEVRTAKLSLENPRILAPFAGTITSRFVEVGQWVVPSETLFTLIDERQKEIEVEVATADSSGIAVGQTVGLSSEAFPGLQWSESVTRLAAAANNKNKANTVSVYISLGNSAPALRFGQQVDADIRTAWNPNAIKLPFAAVLNRGGRSYVALAEQGKVRYAEVVTGIEDFTHVEIQQGISIGQTVIITNGADLQDGERVHLAR